MRAIWFLTEEFVELLGDQIGQTSYIARFREAVRSSRDRYQFGARRHQLKRSLELVDGCERVFGSTDEEAWDSQFRKVARPELRRPARWVERIGKQQQSLDQ